MFQATLFSVDDYHSDVVIGIYETKQEANDSLSKKYEELDASEKMFYHPAVLVVK